MTDPRLPVNDLIVPPAVTKAYLNSYPDAFLKTIADTYEQVRAEQFSQPGLTAAPGAADFRMVAGTHGVGKSHLVDGLIRSSGKPFVICDVDAIIPKFPGFEEQKRQEMIHLACEFNEATFARDMAKFTEKFRPAAKYINDRLMSEAVAAGLPVIYETNAKTPRIGDFMDAVKKAGAVLETHICQAPLSIKQNAFSVRFRNEHDIGVTPDMIADEHAAMLKNMKTLAAKSDGNLSIHWRQGVDEPLRPAAVATRSDYTRDIVAFTGFNAYFIDRGLCITKLMGGRALKTTGPAPAYSLS